MPRLLTTIMTFSPEVLQYKLKFSCIIKIPPPILKNNQILMVNEARQTICNVFTKHLFSEHFTSNFEQSLIIFPDLSTYMSK